VEAAAEATVDAAAEAKVRPAEVVREYGPFPGSDHVRGVTFDGKAVWFADGERIRSFDPESGEAGRAVTVRAEAGTAFDGHHLFQLAHDGIRKVDPATGQVVATIPVPTTGSPAGLTWAEGTLWLALHHEGKIVQLDPETGRVLRTLDATRFVTGVTFVDGELWHGTWEGEQSELRRIDPASSEVLERLAMPEGAQVSGVESNGADLFYCGGGPSGKVRAVRRPRARGTRSPAR
jgi:glutamine cyclotransferase